MLRGAIVSVILLLPPAVTLAEPAVGIWQTEPDRKDLTSHIEIRECGTALCGRIIRAFDPRGRPVTTPNIGKELFWDLKPRGNGDYDDGTVWVPLMNIKARASMHLSGDRLIVRGCKGPVCDGQTWSRVR